MTRFRKRLPERSSDSRSACSACLRSVDVYENPLIMCDPSLRSHSNHSSNHLPMYLSAFGYNPVLLLKVINTLGRIFLDLAATRSKS